MPLSSKVESFTELLWIVAINDFMLKYIAVISKIVIVLCPPYVIAYRKRVRVKKNYRKNLNQALQWETCIR